LDYTFTPILERIKKIKAEQKFTNELLSKKSGIPIGTLSKILAGIIKDPKVGILISLADALGVSVDFLAYGNKDDTGNNTKYPLLEEQELIKKYRVLDERGRKAVEDTLEREYEFVNPRREK